jgi:hypothetical protein
MSQDRYDEGFKDGYAAGKAEGIDPELAEAWREEGASLQQTWLLDAIELELRWPTLDDGFKGGLEWVRRQLTDPDTEGV